MCQIALHGFTPVVCASAWKFGWLGQLNLRIEWLPGLADVSSMEGCVPASEGDDGTVHVGRRSQSGFLSWSGAPDGKQNCDDHQENQEPVYAFHAMK